MKKFIITLKGFLSICVYCDDIHILSDRVFFMKNNDLVTSVICSDILSLDEYINGDFVEIKL